MVQQQGKSCIKRKEDAWKEMLGARDKDARERGLEVYKEEKRKVKGYIYQSKEVQQQFGRKMRKLFWKEVSKVNGGQV